MIGSYMSHLPLRMTCRNVHLVMTICDHIYCCCRWWETPGLDPQQATPASIVDQRMASSFCNKLLPPNIIYLTQKLVHAVKVTAQMGHLVYTRSLEQDARHFCQTDQDAPSSLSFVHAGVEGAGCTTERHELSHSPHAADDLSSGMLHCRSHLVPDADPHL